MNAFAAIDPLTITRLDLAAADEVAMLDRWVCAHPRSTPFHRPIWSAAVETGTGQRTHVLTARRGRTITGVLPLTEIHSPLFGRALVSAGFAVDGGVLADDEAASTALVASGLALAGSLSCGTLELRGGVPPVESFVSTVNAHAGFARPLAASDEAELAAIPRKQRAEVRKALALPLTVATAADGEAAAAHYRVYAESVRNLGTPVFPRTLFIAMLHAFGADADILTVGHAGDPVASVLSLYHRGTVYPFWGGGTAAARTLKANDRMYFALMGHARERGCTRFDFGRSKTGSGAFAFKRNWGFEPEPMTYWKASVNGAPLRDINPNSPRFRLQVELWKRLPLGLATVIGPWIARGLG